VSFGYLSAEHSVELTANLPPESPTKSTPPPSLRLPLPGGYVIQARSTRVRAREDRRPTYRPTTQHCCAAESDSSSTSASSAASASTSASCSLRRLEIDSTTMRMGLSGSPGTVPVVSGLPKPKSTPTLAISSHPGVAHSSLTHACYVRDTRALGPVATGLPTAPRVRFQAGSEAAFRTGSSSFIGEHARP
jgi:hypothetical protein